MRINDSRHTLELCHVEVATISTINRFLKMLGLFCAWHTLESCHAYEVATISLISRFLQSIGLFCRIWSLFLHMAYTRVVSYILGGYD